MLGVILTFALWSFLIILRKVFFLPNSYDSKLIKYCADWVMFSLNLTIKIENAHLYDPQKPAIVIANHSSQIDIPLIYESCSSNLRMVAKREVFWIPLMGWSMLASKHIPIHRGHKDSAEKARKTIASRLAEGYQIFMAPEGTRSANGCLLPFKTGAFRLAVEHKVPIYVLALYKPWEVLPKGQLYSPVKGEMVARFLGRLDPFDDENSVKTHETLLNEARKLYLSNGFMEC